MNNTELHSFNNNLIIKLWSNVIFYIIKDNIPRDILEKIEPIIELDIWNKLFVVDYTLGPVVYQKGIDKNGILLKGIELEQIIFTLFEKKNKLQAYEFNYIFEKYFEQLDCLLYLTNWLQNNLNFIDETDEEVLGLFKVQFLNFKKHFKEIVKHFFPNKLELPQTRFNAFNIIENNFSNLPHSIKNKSLPKFDFNYENNSINKTEKTKKTKKTKKIKLISEERADKVVLKSIFNIEG